MYTLDSISNELRKDGVLIPNDDSTPEYQAYVAWLKLGNGPELVAGEPTHPRIEVSAWQIREALNRIGRRAEIEALVNASNSASMRDGWQYADVFKSDHDFILSMGAAAGMTESDLCGLFEFAASLQL